MSFDPREDVLLVLSYARFCLAAALGEQELCEQWGGGSLPGSLITVRAAPWEQGVGVGVRFLGEKIPTCMLHDHLISRVVHVCK